MGLSNIRQNCSQRAEQDRIRNGDAAIWPTVARTNHAAASYGDCFVLHKMQSNHLDTAVFTEVAGYGIPHHGLKIGPVLSLGEDAVAQGPSVIAALNSFGHLKYDLRGVAHFSTSINDP